MIPSAKACGARLPLTAPPVSAAASAPHRCPTVEGPGRCSASLVNSRIRPWARSRSLRPQKGGPGDDFGSRAERPEIVRAKLISGTISFGEAATKYGEDENAKFTGGLKQGNNGTYLTIDQLDKELVLMLAKMKVGEYSKPVVFSDEREKKGVRIIYLKTRSEPHRENLKDDYNRISLRALEVKKQQVLEKWFSSKIPGYYIMLDEEFKNCENLANWWKYAAKAN